MPLKEEVLGQFLGDEKFPIEWTSETEKLLFWVYDDLHCPKPLSPMYEDIGGWWLSCDHMFRRFGTPFATDWIYKNINGYLYTAAIPAEAGLVVETQEYNYRTNPIVPEAADADYAGKIGAYLGAVLPVYGHKFVEWWRTRFVPEMERNFAYIEGMLDKKDQLSLAEVAVLLEDAIDMHDRHWKIHWMLNFAQLSATLNLRAVMEKTHGKIDEVLLGRLQNSANDRNWDKIRALWEMKEEVKANPELSKAFAGLTAADIIPALKASERGRRFIDERVVPYQKEFGWHAVWSHEFVFPSFREDMTPVVQLVRDQYSSDYDYPSKIARPQGGHRRGRQADPRGARGRGARGDARRQRDQPQDGAAHPGPPLLHRPGRQRPRPPRAHRPRREARGDGGPRPARRRHLLPLQPAPRVHRQPDRDRRTGHRHGRPRAVDGGEQGRGRGTGSAPSPRRSSPSRTSTSGASRTSSTAPPRSSTARSRASPARRASSRASPASSARWTSSTASRSARSSSAR